MSLANIRLQSDNRQRIGWVCSQVAGPNPEKFGGSR